MVVIVFQLRTVGDVNGCVFAQWKNFQHEAILIHGGAVATQANFKGPGVLEIIVEQLVGVIGAEHVAGVMDTQT